MHVNVFQLAAKHELAGFDLGQHAIKAGRNFAPVLLTDDALGGQHGRVHLGGTHVEGSQRLVEVDGGVYVLQHLGR